MEKTTAWHAGELVLQRRLGVAEKMDPLGRRFIRDHLIDQHREFFPMLPFVAIGAVDRSGDAWATIRAGVPGFLSAADEHHLRIEMPRDFSDPAEDGMEDGNSVGLLGIDLTNRRRNRLNGTIRRDPSGARIEVVQSYGNCPRYIGLREPRFVRDAHVLSDHPPAALAELDAAARALIAGADTFFVASYVDEADRRSVDVSHRGGRPGFVWIDPAGRLNIPDFNGNLFFNTLGNFVLNPRAGLAFVDFESGEMLQMTGEAEILLDGPEIGAFEGMERMWRFTPRRIIRRADALPLRWSVKQDNIHASIMMTGTWEETARTLEAERSSARWRPFRVADIVEETGSIRSLYLEPADGQAIIRHRAGQHLPIRLTIDGKQVDRTYTISSAPSDGRYRLSVKRDGLASAALHALKAGDLILARAPSGNFVIEHRQERPAVLIGAGIGITPMIAMARHIIHEGERTRFFRQTYLIQAARNQAERAFDRELRDLAGAAGGAVKLVRVLSAPLEGDVDADHVGRVDMKLLRSILPFGDYDFYLCGPPDFMQSLHDGLRRLDVAEQRIHAEAFGPSAIARHGNLAPAALASVAVFFTGSGKEARWTPAGGSLLELAEERGLEPKSSCRSGYCGTCKAKVLAGTVTYLAPPTASHGDDEALLCCAVPAETTTRLEIDI